MNVLIVNGSPHREGNVSVAVDELMKSIALGKEKFGLPEKETPVQTSFVRE